ncbi:MAG: hypothetical protein V1908_04855 [Candidatus Peregrinibacteria bacterium]
MEPKNKHPACRQAGKTHPRAFSLIDVVFSMVFLTVIVLGVVKLQTSNLALSNTQNSTARAYELANQSLEIVEAIGETGIDSSSCVVFPCLRYLKPSGDSYVLDPVPPLPASDFERTIKINRLGIAAGAITINSADPAIVTNGYQVTALIQWTDSSGEHSVDAKRIIYE